MPVIRQAAILLFAALAFAPAAPAAAECRLSGIEFAEDVVTVSLSEPAAWQATFWNTAKRLVLDIPATGIDLELRNLPVGSERLAAVRWNQYKPDTVRVVLDLERPEQPRVLSAPGSSVIRVFVGAGQPPSDTLDAAPAADTGSTDRPGTFRITDIRIERGEDETVSRVVILTEKPASPVASWSGNSLFLDYSAGENGLGERVFMVGEPGLLRVRPVRMAGGCRVALDFAQRVSYKLTPLADENGIALEYVVSDTPATDPEGTVELDPDIGKPRVPKRLDQMLVVVDAGHGAHDSGARGPWAVEKEANLDMAKRLKSLLEERGARVVMTRSDDTFIALKDRPALAMRLKADAFVSIHCNSSRRPTNRGVEVFYRRNDADSRRLAAALYRTHRQATGLPGRGIRPDSRAPQGGLAVLKHNTVPCALVEVGFINSPDEGRKIADPAWRQKVAEALVRGLRLYGGAEE